MAQNAGTAATVAIVVAVGSFILSFAGRPGWGLLAALVSVPAGVVGLVSSASPRVGGGKMSIAAIVLGLIAIGIAVLGLIGAVVF